MKLVTFLAVSAIFCLSVMVASAASATDQELRSGPARAALVELYTSEGCSSCPPADRWMTGLVDDARLWKSIVPIAFHVDYWDYIGWKDEYAEQAFGQRQRTYREKGHVRSVYTPGFVVSGQEWRGWFRRPLLEVPSAPDPGILAVKREQRALSVSFEPTPSGRAASTTVHVAVLGFNLSTDVQAGENHGRKLYHNFVVLGYESKPMVRKDGQLLAQLELPKTRVDAPKTALAVWVSGGDDPKPIQALGGWM